MHALSVRARSDGTISGMPEPEIRYVRSADGTTIATATVGSGPTLVMVPPFGLESIESSLALPEVRHAFDLLAQRFTFVTFDPRGQGLSSRDVADLSMDARMADIEAVFDGLQIGAAHVLARVLSCPATIAFAAAYPDRVARLALWEPVARGRDMRLHPRRRTLAPLIDVDFELYVQSMALLDFGWTEAGRVYAEQGTRVITAEMVHRNWIESRKHDASHLLSQLACPTLIIHSRSAEATVAFEVARDIAATIPNARFHMVARDSRFAFAADPETDVRLLTSFFEDEQSAAAVPTETQKMAVILFADIVNSTALTESLGDAAFRGRADSLDSAMRTANSGCGGATIEGKLLGDGLLAVFTSVRQAINAATQCRAAAADNDLQLHLGLHAGDVIRDANNVYGGAVNIAARIASESRPNEILVSDVVRSLGRTSAGVEFDDRGERSLKGIADAQRLFSVRDA